MKYILEDGGIINASSNEEFVEQLKDGSKFDSHLSTEEYIEAFSKRISMYYGKKILSGSVNILVQELKRIGYLKIE
ncbi:MAG: hypothetical protein WCL51_14730 [Bacteroidota bacterium]